MGEEIIIKKKHLDEISQADKERQTQVDVIIYRELEDMKEESIAEDL